MKKIAIYSEIKGKTLDKTAYELISKANDIRNFAKNLKNFEIQITNILIAPSVDEESVKKAYRAGADAFVLIKNEEFENFNQIIYSNAFLNYLYQNPHDYILFPATPTGRMIAPRVTTALDTGLVADCTGIDFIIKDNNLKMASTRPTFGAELMATILSRKTPECATVRPKTFIPKFNKQESGEYIEFPISIANNFEINIIDSSKKTYKSQNFENSKIIFCAGFGLYDGKENTYITKLKGIAQQLGVDFAITRKLVDYGILDHEYQIGQTGTTVSPDIYIAFGVSGAIQHIQGMKNSKTIVAINSDPDAEIFKYADYKIVADAKIIIDDLLNSVM